MRHPCYLYFSVGGADVILSTASQVPDITDVMQDGPHSHSPNAYILLENYKIGELEDSEMQNIPEAKFRLVNGIPVHSYKDDNEIDWDKPVVWQVSLHILSSSSFSVYFFFHPFPRRFFFDSFHDIL